MGNSASNRFIESFDPSVPIPKGVNHPEYRVHAAVPLNLAVPSSDSSNAPVLSVCPWLMWHAIAKANCPYLARGDFCGTAYGRHTDGAIPVTIMALNHEASFPGGPQGRAATFASVAALLRAISYVVPSSDGIVDEREAASPSASRFPIAVQHIESNGDQVPLFAVIAGQYVPICRAAPVKVNPGAEPISNPIDVHGSATWHPFVTNHRPLRKRPIFAPDIMGCNEVLLGLCDIAESLHALHVTHSAQHRTLSWNAIYARNDSPGGRMFWVPWEPLHCLTQGDMASIAGIQKRIVDASLARSKNDLVLCAPEDKDPSLTDAARRALPVHASDSFAFGVMLQQCMPASVMEGVTALSTPNVSIASPRNAAEALAIFAVKAQSADPQQRPTLQSFLELPIVKRCTFVRVMQGLDRFYPSDALARAPCREAATLPVKQLLLGSDNADHLERAVFMAGLHVEMLKLPYEQSIRRVVPRLLVLDVLNDPCASPLFEHLLKAVDPNVTPPKPVGAAIPIGAAASPGLQRPNRFVVYGLIQQEHQVAWMTALLTSPHVGFGEPCSVVAQHGASHRWLVLLRHLEQYVFHVDISVITANIVPGVVALLAHPYADVAAAALIAFGKLCKFVFAAVERGRDVGSAKDSLVRAYDEQIYHLAVKQAVPEVRIAAMRVAARSIEKHKLMSRSKVCSVLRQGLQADAPIKVVEATLALVNHLTTSNTASGSASAIVADLPTTTDDDTASSRRSVSPSAKASVGVFQPAEIAQYMFPGLVGIATAFAGSSDPPQRKCADDAAALFSRLCDDCAQVELPPHAPAEGVFVNSAATVATSSEWDATNLLGHVAKSHSPSADLASQVASDPLRAFHSHTLVVPVPIMPVDADGFCRYVPQSHELPPRTSSAYAPTLSSKDGTSVIEVPTIVVADDFDSEWCSSAFLALPAAQSANSAGPNLRPHPVAPYLPSRLAPTASVKQATVATAAAPSTGKGRSAAQAKREAAAVAARLAAELAAQAAAEAAASEAAAPPIEVGESRDNEKKSQAPDVPPPPPPPPPASTTTAATTSKAPRRRQQLPAQAPVVAPTAPIRLQAWTAPKDDDDDL